MPARNPIRQPKRANAVEKADESLRQSEESYRTLFNSLDEGFCIIEVIFDQQETPVDYRFLEVNPSFEKQSGLHNATGKRMRELAPNHESHWFEIYGRVALTGEPMRFVNEAKELNRWFDVYVCRLGGAESRKVAVLFTNITARKEAEAELRRSEERFRTLADNMSQFAWMADPGGWIFWYNKRWFDYTGTTLEEMQGWGWRNVHHPDHVERVVERIQRSWDTGEAWEDTFPLRGRDGIYRWFLSRALPIRDAEGVVIRWFGTNTDVTEQREAEAALRESEARVQTLFESAEAARVSAETARARAEAATRAKDDFLAALSHELRTPLNPALLLVTSLARDASLPPHLREDIDVIANGIALQARLVDDLLDLTRITTGKLRLDLRPIDAHLALRQAHQILRAEMRAPQIEVTFHLAAPRSFIEADAVRMEQIFWNVLKNAVKFTPPGGAITVRTRVAREETLLVEIADNGVGIEPAMLGKVFDAFVQEEHGGAHRFGGIGLGLAITRRLVETQGGRIEAQSAGRGRGATFVIELPLAAEAPAAADASAPIASAETPRPAAARRILVVEDHEQTRITLARLLERRGHTVTSAATVAAACELAATAQFDLVISDLGLPDGDGYALMAELRDAYELPGIALSGYGMEKDVAHSRRSGFFIHLTKPVDIHALESAISAASSLACPASATKS